MRKDMARRWSITLLLSMCSLLGTGCHPVSLSPAEVVADSVRDFSGKQGDRGWSYGYWDRSADTDKRYDQATDFRLLRHFGGDPINGISGHSEFTTGELWNLQDGLYYTSLWAAGGHPNSASKLGEHAEAEQWAVRRWVSTTRGPITISGHAGKVMPWGEKWSGGCQAQIVVDGTTLFRAALENQRTDYSIDATVKVGSLVDFLIGPNPSVGVIEFTATIYPQSVKISLPRQRKMGGKWTTRNF
jgi:hypothetical protein